MMVRGSYVLNALCCAAVLALCVSCRPAAEDHAETEDRPTSLRQVGSISITQADLDFQVEQKHAGRSDAATKQQALDELVERAHFTQAALDAGLGDDPLARAEIARVLSLRLKETKLNPMLLAAMSEPITDARLRELYDSQVDRFQSVEQRQVAVLWLNPGADPERAARYVEKLTQAQDWFAQDDDLRSHPDKGFSVLSVDHSEHAATRYNGGVLGWVDQAGGGTNWSRQVAAMVFSLNAVGEVSPVVSNDEGVFLVRFMALKPAVQRPFESVRNILEREERNRQRAVLEAEYRDAILSRYPMVSASEGM